MKKLLALILLFSLISTSCGTKLTPHKGTFPFSSMEKPLSKISANKKAKTAPLTQLEEVFSYTPNEAQQFEKITKRLQAGDVIAFYMSHSEARRNLRQRKIQKIPYELFSFGHLAIVSHATFSAELKLLQVAMKQSINANSGLGYLKDKCWVTYRPPNKSIDTVKLGEFSQHVCCSGKSGYSYTASLGLINGDIHPSTRSEIKDKYTCTTLVIAALHHAGFHLHTSHRKGYLDLITPRQVVDSWGSAVSYHEK